MALAKKRWCVLYFLSLTVVGLSGLGYTESMNDEILTVLEGLKYNRSLVQTAQMDYQIEAFSPGKHISEEGWSVGIIIWPAYAVAEKSKC